MLVRPGQVIVQRAGGPHPPRSGVIGDVNEMVTVVLDVACDPAMVTHIRTCVYVRVHTMHVCI